MQAKIRIPILTLGEPCYTSRNPVKIQDEKTNGKSTSKFLSIAEDAKNNCPVSKALNMDITLEAELSEKIMA